MERFSGSQYENDIVRYRLEPPEEDQMREFERALPVAVWSRVRHSVREFGKDTQTLLSFVYRTGPMLRAARR